MTPKSALKRTLTLPLVTFYGLGTIIGAGIYALIGSVIQEAGSHTPFAFFIAAAIALFTAATYAELSSRFPQSAGSALYFKKAFNIVWGSRIIGWLTALTGVVSAATLCHGFINYLQIFYHVSSYLIIPLLILILGAISIWGISESVISIMIMTIIEITGLLIIIWYGKESFNQITLDWHQYIPSMQSATWSGILAGSFIAFYAFIGFEDMVNLAEETTRPEKTLPRGIFLAFIGATVLYLLISFVTVTTLPYQEFAQSQIPLTLIIIHQNHSPIFFGLIALLAITNGILVQIIMASRLIYGMTRLASAPKFFSYIYEKTQVPILSILLVVISIIIFAFLFPIKILAEITSTVMLCIFTVMHLSLICIKYKNPYPKNAISFPMIIPIIGLFTSMAFIVLPIFLTNTFNK